MKKFLSMFLALVVVLSALAMFAACDNGKDKDDDKDDKKGTTTVVTTTEAPTTATPTTAAPKVPNGYKLYNGEGFSFAYPETWTDSGMQGVVFFQNASTGSSLNVVSEIKTSEYDNITIDSFNAIYKPAYESVGMAVSNPKVNYETIDGVRVLNLSFDVEMSGVSMKMAQFVFSLENSTYSITVSEVKGADSGVINTVYDSLSFAKDAK